MSKTFIFTVAVICLLWGNMNLALLVQYDLLLSKTSLIASQSLSGGTEWYDVREYAYNRAVEGGINADSFVRLIECESGWNPHAKNSKSTATGLLQFLTGTWQATDSYYYGASPHNAYASIEEGVIAISNGESWKWIECLDKDNIKF